MASLASPAPRDGNSSSVFVKGGGCLVPCQPAPAPPELASRLSLFCYLTITIAVNSSQGAYVTLRAGSSGICLPARSAIGFSGRTGHYATHEPVAHRNRALLGYIAAPKSPIQIVEGPGRIGIHLTHASPYDYRGPQHCTATPRVALMPLWNLFNSSLLAKHRAASRCPQVRCHSEMEDSEYHSGVATEDLG
ncbi:hypothetical protein PG999_008600 [Apiospora kogelbergensis]|uniref:Uncharacterized protein n=1 Tax=Apiospora kogelbergensis TaxID=1337665 RepID=A0AAW0QRR9_9PEZI